MEFRFSNWIKYKDYKKLDGCKLPGVYIMAHFKKVPASTGSPSSKNVIYIGETTSQTIEKRLYQFGYSAFKHGIAHSGGWSYSYEFLNNEITEEIPDNLYVSIMGVDKPQLESKAYIKYLERAAIWDHFKKNKSYPICNNE